jgi:hypothetical protein
VGKERKERIGTTLEEEEGEAESVDLDVLFDGGLAALLELLKLLGEFACRLLVEEVAIGGKGLEVDDVPVESGKKHPLLFLGSRGSSKGEKYNPVRVSGVSVGESRKRRGRKQERRYERR